jgi:hypothetical protein
VVRCQHFRDHAASIFRDLWNIGILPKHYRASQSRRPWLLKHHHCESLKTCTQEWNVSYNNWFASTIRWKFPHSWLIGWAEGLELINFMQLFTIYLSKNQQIRILYYNYFTCYFIIQHRVMTVLSSYCLMTKASCVHHTASSCCKCSMIIHFTCSLTPLCHPCHVFFLLPFHVVMKTPWGYAIRMN